VSLLYIYYIILTSWCHLLQEHMELEKRYRELTDLLVRFNLKQFALYFIIWVYFRQILIKTWHCYMCALFQYHKQTQLEAMASEKAAAEFQLETSRKSDARRLQEALVFSSHLFVSLACRKSLQLCKHFNICWVGRSRKK